MDRKQVTFSKKEDLLYSGGGGILSSGAFNIVSCVRHDLTILFVAVRKILFRIQPNYHCERKHLDHY
jgi:hypothetical protein